MRPPTRRPGPRTSRPRARRRPPSGCSSRRPTPPPPRPHPRRRRGRATAPVGEPASTADRASEEAAEETVPATTDGDEPTRARRGRGSRSGRSTRAAQDDAEQADDLDRTDTSGEARDADDLRESDDAGEEGAGEGRRRRRRGGKGRGRGRGSADGDTDESSADEGADRQPDTGPRDGQSADDADEADDEGGGTRRRRRRRRSGSSAEGDDPPGTVTRVRESRRERDEPQSVKGSTRLEAKKQRRREGREAGRRRTIITEAEFLARRESVERVMVVREREGRTQIGVLEDDVLVEHYVSRETNVSMAGNVYLGRVQNVLPSMEAAFVDIGKGRNAVLYAGEVNWDAAGLEGNQPQADRERPEVGRLRARAGDQGPDRPQGRPADQPDLAPRAATSSTCPRAR